MARLSVGSVAAGHMFGDCMKTHNLMGMELRDGCLAFTPDNSEDNGMFYLQCGCHCSFHKVEKIEQWAIKHDPDTQSQPSGSRVDIVRNYRKYSNKDCSKMLAMARKLQWKMSGRNKEAKARLDEFCIGVDIKYRTFNLGSTWLREIRRFTL